MQTLPIAGQQLTLDNIVNYLQNFATNHKQVGGFYYGALYDINDWNGINYPLLGVVPQPSIIHKGWIELKLDCYMVDKITQCDENRPQVLSDCFYTLLDLNAYITKDFSVWLLPSQDNDIKPLYENFDDYVGGWVMTLVIQLDYIGNVCTIPGVSTDTNT
jgi:hypothetical protein